MAKSRIDPEEGVPPKLSKDSASGRINVIATEEMLRELDEWRREHPALPNKSEAVRLLVSEALTLWRARKNANARES